MGSPSLATAKLAVELGGEIALGAKPWTLLHDVRLDSVARTAWEVLAVRIVMGVGAALLGGWRFGLAWGLGWFGRAQRYGRQGVVDIGRGTHPRPGCRRSATR